MNFCDPEIEKAFLGSFSIDPEMVNETCSDITPDHFFVPAHKACYSTMLALRAEGVPINDATILVPALIKDHGDNTPWGVVAVDILTHTPTAVNAVFHAESLRDWKAKRDVGAAVTEWAAKLNSDGGCVRGDDFIRSIHNDITKIQDSMSQDVLDRITREREATALACILQSTDEIAAERVDAITEGCFRRPCNQRIFSELRARIILKKSYMLSDFLDHIRHHNLLEKCGGVGYITSLYRRKAADVDYKSICDYMADDMARRTLMAAARDISSAALDTSKSVDALSEYAESRIMDMDLGRSEEYKTESVSDVVMNVMRNLEQKVLRLNDGGVNGIPISGLSLSLRFASDNLLAACNNDCI